MVSFPTQGLSGVWLGNGVYPDFYCIDLLQGRTRMGTAVFSATGGIGYRPFSAPHTATLRAHDHRNREMEASARIISSRRGGKNIRTLFFNTPWRFVPQPEKLYFPGLKSL